MESLAWEKFLIGTPGIKEQKIRSSVHVVVIFWTKIFILHIKNTELFTV